MSNTLNNPYYSDLTGQLQCTFIRSVDNGTSGDCTLITGEVTGLIDLGADPTLERVRGKIWEKGTRTLVGSDEKVKLDFVVLTHYHADHVTSDIASAINSLSTDSRIDLSSCVFYLPHNGLDLTYTGSGETWEAENHGFRIYTDENTGIKYPRIKQIRDRQTACENKLTEYYGSSATTHIIKPVASNDDPLNTTWEETAVEKVFNDHLKLSFLNVNPDNYQYYYPYTGSNQNWADHGTDYNAFSMLTILEHYNHKFVFTGDMVMPAQEKYANWVTDCDVYKVEHHGLEYNTSDKWLNALNPKYAVICNYDSYYLSDTLGVSFPRDNEYTNRKTVQQLASKGCKILSTHDKEFIDINSTYEKLWVDTDMISDYHVGPGYVNATYPYYVAAMKRVTAYRGSGESESRVSKIIGGCTRYGNIIIVQLHLVINTELAGGHWYRLLSNLPKPKKHKDIVKNGTEYVTVEYDFHTPLSVIKESNNSKSYSGWINKDGNLYVGIFNSASTLSAGDNVFISGVYVTDE